MNTRLKMIMIHAATILVTTSIVSTANAAKVSVPNALHDASRGHVQSAPVFNPHADQMGELPRNIQ